MAEHDVTMKFGTALKAGGDDALRQIGRAAKSAQADTDSLWKGFDDALRRATKGIGDADAALKNFGKNGASSIDKINAEMSKLDKQMRGVGKQGFGVDPARLNVKQQGGGASRIGGEMLGMAGLPSSVATLGGAFTALAATIKLADIGLKIYSESFYRGKFDPGAAQKNLQQFAMDHLPGVASASVGEMGSKQFSAGAQALLSPLSILSNPKQWWSDITNESGESSLNVRKERENNLRESAEGAGIRGGIRTREFMQTRPLGLEKAELEGKARFGLTSSKDAFAIEQQARAKLSNAFGKAGHTPGYTREAELSDIALRTRTEAATLQQSAESKRQLGILGAKKTSAGATTEAQERAVKEQRQQVGIALTAVHAAGSGEQEMNARITLERQLVDLKEKEARLAESLEEKLRLERETVQTTLGLHQQKLSLLRSESDAIAHARQEEQARKQGLKENLGLMHPAKLRTAVGIQRKIAMGRQLTQGEIGFAQSMPGDIFKNSLRDIGNKRATQGMSGQMIQELMKGSHQDVRGKELGKLQANADLRVQVELGTSAAVMDKLQKPLEAALRRMEAAINVQTKDMLDRAMNQQRMQGRAATGG